MSLKINIGCGPTGQIGGFDNLDNSPGVSLAKWRLLKWILFTAKIINETQYKTNWNGVIKCDASKGLPYKDNSVDKIYSSHFLEHIPPHKGIFVIKECYRVLRDNGTMRLVVPDLLHHAEQYTKETKILMRASQLPSDRSIHDIFMNTVCGAYLSRKRYGAEHAYMYDFPTLVAILKDAGFQRIVRCEYRNGSDNELALYDSRPDDSLHLEITK